MSFVGDLCLFFFCLFFCFFLLSLSSTTGTFATDLQPHQQTKTKEEIYEKGFYRN